MSAGATPVPELTPFDVLGPLPQGTTLLEASAGTGKTWTIGALVARYVAEGHARLDELLVVTFGRAASQELRQRVRSQLVDVATALAATLARSEAGSEPGSGADGVVDEVVALLCTGDRATLRARHARVSSALAHFDGATIATIHQFCQQVLRSLGVAGDTDPSARLVEDVGDVRDEVVDDLYLRGFVDEEAPVFSVADARRLGAVAVGDPQAALVPEHPADGTPALRRVRFARAVRAEVDRRKRRAGLLGYDDLLGQLATALEEPGAAARARMRQRWRVVLVDEFQDTDPVQWQVFDRAFSGHATMVLIGDPRAGDLRVPRRRRRDLPGGGRHRLHPPDAGHQLALRPGPRRGDEPPARGHGAGGRPHRGAAGARPPHRCPAERGPLGRSVPAAGRAPHRREPRDAAGSRAAHGPGAAPRRHRLRPRRRGAARLGRAVGRPSAPGRRRGGARPHPAPARRRAGRPGRGRRARRLRGRGSVFATPAAEEWRTLLSAVDAPHRSLLVRAAALTSFFPDTPASLATEGDRATDRTADVLRRWSVLLARRGVAAVFEAAQRGGLAARVLARVEGSGT
ncbi:UvrD-helicase domain-containing protein [Nocardioides zeae]